MTQPKTKTLKSKLSLALAIPAALLVMTDLESLQWWWLQMAAAGLLVLLAYINFKEGEDEHKRGIPRRRRAGYRA